jgi:hypothetical protein
LRDRWRAAKAAARAMVETAPHIRSVIRAAVLVNVAAHAACWTGERRVFIDDPWAARRLRLQPAPGDDQSGQVCMKAKTLDFREGIASAAVFGFVMFALISIDPRVKAQVTDLVRAGSVTSWSDRLGDLGGALWAAARDHSIDSAPLLVFATVGAVLTVFMLKS